MSLDLTFKNVCATIKKQGKDDPKLIEAVDNLLGLALICSPVVLGPAAAALLPLLSLKNELVKIGKGVFDKLTKKKDEDYILRYDTMSTAYGLLVFTAFFDALDSRLSETLRKEIALLNPEKAFLAKDAVSKITSKKIEKSIGEEQDAPISEYTFPFPHPTETLTEQCQRQLKLWKQMGKGFVDFVQKLAFWENADDQKRAGLLSGLEKIEEEAAKRFEAQYFELARKFEDFAVWANLQAHKDTKALIGALSDYVKQHAQLSASSETAIDVGFAKLRETVLRMPETLHAHEANEIAASLNRHYQARIRDPIIEDKEPGDDSKPRLSFPKVCDAFVPQAFHVLRQTANSRRLEDEATWNGLPRRNDLGAFLLSYLSSPYSTEAPLLILGHPGSGKSLLTTILSAQLASEQFTAIRVPLREVNADADIVTQIEDGIRRITGVSFDSWIKLSARFKNCPPLVILDGYDELLQASGQVFVSYIKDAQRFQERETEQGRPVRIIITSRVTLIDKAAVPAGATIVRLLEFDRQQRECWSTIWNKANAVYFQESGIEKFTLPDEKEIGAEKILNLAEQPLLLLMLALYDSQDNQLRGSKGLDRTKLYDSLLRRFVVRERGKEKGFNDAKEKERDKALSAEMQRLGVAALGMYNRRKVHILSPELDDDLSFFKLEREVLAKPGKGLSQADLLLGSFFFVHKSKAQHSSGPETSHEETAAFEFLHNTFGEFLTADFIVRRAVAQVQTLRAAESNEALRSMIDKMMGTADGFERDWFASLVYTPLFTRPVVMEMVREWTPHVLKDNGVSGEDFVVTLEKIVLNQLKRMLNKREMPQIMRKETAQEGYRVPFGDHPLVGHIAIYSINLILLRLVSGKRPFIFDETEVASHEDGTRPWDRLIHIWRSWFALGNLNGLTAVMLAERENSKITITAKDKFQAVEAKSKLHEFYNVALSLGDSVGSGITGLYLIDPASGDSKRELRSIEQHSHSESLDLDPPLLIARLLVLAQHFTDSPRDFVRYGGKALEQIYRTGRRDQLENVCLIITRVLEEQMYSVAGIASGNGSFRDVLDPRLAVEIARRDPRSARILVGLGARLRDFDWLDEFWGRFLDSNMTNAVLDFGSPTWTGWIHLLQEFAAFRTAASLKFPRRIHHEFLERMLDPRFLRELIERTPETTLPYLQILKDLGGSSYIRQFIEGHIGPELFERILYSQYLLELSDRDPEAALAYLQSLRELSHGRNWEQYVERMRPELIERLFHPRHLQVLSDRDPEAALAYLQSLRELSHGRNWEQHIERMRPEFIERLFHPRHLQMLSERNPTAALAYLQLLREFGNERHWKRYIEREMEPEFVERLFHPRHLLELSEQNPEAALAYLQLLREFGNEKTWKQLLDHRELLERIFPRSLFEFPGHRFPNLSLWLACARLFGSKSFNQQVATGISELLDNLDGTKRLLSSLPIGSFADLRWLSEQTQAPKLQAVIAELTERHSAGATPRNRWLSALGIGR